MAQSKSNLNAVFTDTANAIRAMSDTTAKIRPIDFADKINGIPGMKLYLELGGKCAYSPLTTFERVIKYSFTENVRDMSNMFNNCDYIKKSPSMNTSSATNMSYMFASCANLEEIISMDTSNVTDMSDMFYNCISLKSIAQLNTTKVTNMSEMFKYCDSLTTIPEFDTSNVNNMEGMFSGCSYLTTIPLINTSNVKKMSSMFINCSKLTSLPTLNTSNATNMSYMFGGCQKLTEIPAFDCSSCTNLQGFMQYTYAVTAIHLRNIKADLDISGPRNLTREAIVEVLNNLATVTSAHELYMGSKNLAKLTDEDKAIATNKGWTLA